MGPVPEGALVLDTPVLGLLIVPGAAERGEELQNLADRAADYATRARGEGTLRAYRSGWRGFCSWCKTVNQEPLSGDPNLLAMYATKRADAGHAVSSIRVALAAIKTAHLYAGVGLDMRDSRLAMVMDGIARSKGTRPKRQAAAAVPETMRKLLASLPIQTSSEEENPTITAQSASQAIKIRNRAMMLLGFGGALRRSEIVALNIGDVEIIEDKGLAVLIRQSKGDQQGAGQTVAIWANEKEREFCPMAALIAWLKIRQDEQRLKSYDNGGLERPLFCAVLRDGTLSGHAMADKVIPRIIKQAAEETGFNPEKFSGHSLRRGLLTAAGNLRLPLRDVMKHSRHKSVETAMGYMESGEMWRNNITEDIFHAD